MHPNVLYTANGWEEFLTLVGIERLWIKKFITLKDRGICGVDAYEALIILDAYTYAYILTHRYVESMSTRIEEYVCMHAGMHAGICICIHSSSISMHITCHPNVPLPKKS